MQQFIIKAQDRALGGRRSTLRSSLSQIGAHDRYRMLFVMLILCLALLPLSACGPSTSQVTSQTGQSSGQASPQRSTYVAIGASDTFGIGTQDPYTQNWPSDLTDLLSSEAHVQLHLINLGIPGMTLHAALSTELPVALTTHPSLITIWLAVNDLATKVSVDSYSHDLNALLNSLQAAAPKAQIEVANVPDLTSIPFFRTYNQLFLRQQTLEYNTAIDHIVQSHHVTLVDLSGQGYDLQAFPQYISSDGLHPSESGYLQLAMLFYAALHEK